MNTPKVFKSSDGDFWLIRKPKDAPLETLLELKFPKRIKPKEVRVRKCEFDPETLPESSTEYVHLNATFERSDKPIIHLSHRDFSGADSAGEETESRPFQIFHGLCNIYRENKLDNDFPLPPEENFLEPEEPETEIPRPPRKIRSICKRILVDYDSLPQRLQVFGVPLKKKKDKNRDKNELVPVLEEMSVVSIEKKHKKFDKSEPESPSQKLQKIVKQEPPSPRTLKRSIRTKTVVE